MKTFAQMTDSQKNIVGLTILFLILEKEVDLSKMLEGDLQFMDPFMTEMAKADLIKLSDKGDGKWLVTPKGFELRRQMVGMHDQLFHFQTFRSVEPRYLTKEEALPDDPHSVPDTEFDPRFVRSDKSEDLRLAMIEFVADAQVDKLGGMRPDPLVITYMHLLLEGVLDRENFWLDMRLGKIFKEVEEIVESRYKWQDLAEDEAKAADLAMKFYTAGMLEHRKREGKLCANPACNACLAIAQDNAAKDEQELTNCPECDADLTVVATIKENCPKCGDEIFPRQRKCRGCGASISRKLPEGKVQTKNVARETVSYTTVWSDSYADYGYVPYGYYDPYDMALDVAAFSLLCCCTIW